MKARGLIDFRPAETERLLSALGQGDLDGVLRDATVYGPGEGTEVGKSATAPASRDLPSLDDWYVSLPLSVLNFRIMTLPFSDPGTIAKVVPCELDNLALGGSQDVVFDIVVLRSLEGGAEVLVVYLEKQVLRSLLDLLSETGVDPRAVTSVELRAALDEGRADVADFIAGERRFADETRARAAVAELTGRPVINLRSGSFAYTRETVRLWKAARITAALLFVLGALIHAAIGLGTVSAKAESSSVRDALRKEYHALFPEERRVSDELYQLKSHMKSLRDKRAALVGASPLRTLKMLSESRTQGTYLTEMTVDQNSVSLKGESPSVSEVDSFKSRLAPHLTDLRVTDVRPMADGKTSFGMNAGATAP
jgi:hypothetical protein